MSLIDDIRKDFAPACDVRMYLDAHRELMARQYGDHIHGIGLSSGEVRLLTSDLEALLSRIEAADAALLVADDVAGVLAQVQELPCEVCGGDCGSANPRPGYCPVRTRRDVLADWRKATGEQT